MAKPVQNFIVGVRHGGDTRYTTETLIIGAKTPDEAVETAKRDYVKHYHYSCRRAETNPETVLKQGEILRRSAEGIRGDRLTYHPMKKRT